MRTRQDRDRPDTVAVENVQDREYGARVCMEGEREREREREREIEIERDREREREREIEIERDRDRERKTELRRGLVFRSESSHVASGSRSEVSAPPAVFLH